MLVDQDFHSVVHNRLRQGGEGNIGTTLLSCEVSTAADYIDIFMIFLGSFIVVVIWCDYLKGSFVSHTINVAYIPLYAYVYYMHKPNVGRRQHMDGAGGMENVYGNLF